MVNEKPGTVYAQNVLSNGVKRVFAAIALVAIFLLAAKGIYHFYNLSAPVLPAQVQGLRTIQLKGQTIRVSVADTESGRKQGLSGRPGLAPDEGMLFVFPKDGSYAIWMKDMRFSIDIVWLAADPSNPSGQAVIVYMAQNVSPDSFPQNFVSDTLARYVLELPAGYAQAHDLSVGDIVRL